MASSCTLVRSSIGRSVMENTSLLQASGLGGMQRDFSEHPEFDQSFRQTFWIWKIGEEVIIYFSVNKVFKINPMRIEIST